MDITKSQRSAGLLMGPGLEQQGQVGGEDIAGQG